MWTWKKIMLVGIFGVAAMLVLLMSQAKDGARFDVGDRLWQERALGVQFEMDDGERANSLHKKWVRRTSAPSPDCPDYASSYVSSNMETKLSVSLCMPTIQGGPNPRTRVILVFDYTPTNGARRRGELSFKTNVTLGHKGVVIPISNVLQVGLGSRKLTAKMASVTGTIIIPLPKDLRRR